MAPSFGAPTEPDTTPLASDSKNVVAITRARQFNEIFMYEISLSISAGR